MRRNAFLAFTFGVATATSVGGGLMAAETAPEPHWTLLNNYCEKCHNTTDWTGGVAFDTMQPSGIPEDAKIWEAAVSKLRGRMMPPPGQKQPDQATIDSFVSITINAINNQLALVKIARKVIVGCVRLKGDPR